MSLSEKIAKLQEVRKVELEATGALTLPLPAQHDPQLWPTGPRVWLYKAGLSNDDITALGFYWNERLSRVVMPVHEAGKLVYWQARGFDKDRAKYLNPIVGRAVIMPKFGSGTVIVLTEDILSAFKVSRVTEAWSLMGTSFSDGMVLAIAAQGRPVATMLDPDAGGSKGRAAAWRQLSLMGVKVTQLHPKKDPKLLSTQEIRECLENHGLQ